MRKIFRSVLLAVVAFASPQSGLAEAGAMKGLPFSRSYPLDEVGDLPLGDRLSFDPFGRVAVVNSGIYSVLNDTVWINRARPDAAESEKMSSVIFAADGTAYYGARGVWGSVHLGKDGLFGPQRLGPDDPPSWTRTAYFDQIIPTHDGVYFGSWNGVIFWDPLKRETKFFELSGIARVFGVGERIFISSFGRPLLEIDPRIGALRPVVGSERLGSVVERSASLDPSSSLLGTGDGRLLIFNGVTFQPWEPQQRHGISGRITALQALVEGGVAVAVAGKGVFLMTKSGDLMHALTTSRYRSVTGLGAREPGVLWMVGESALEKVLYGSPITTFGEHLGLRVGWPQLQQFGDTVYAISDGTLYKGETTFKGGLGRFAAATYQPPGGAWSQTVAAGQLLVGSSNAVFVMRADSTMEKIADVGNLAHLIRRGKNQCYAIGVNQIALLEFVNGTWTEAAPRIAGMRYVPIAHAGKDTAWIEMGPDGVARLSLEEGQLVLRTVDPQFPPFTWVNLGFIDNTVIFTNPDGGHAFYDDVTREFIAAPALKELFERSPHTLLRAKRDSSGVIWASHSQGVIAFMPSDDGYTMESKRFELSYDRYPSIQILNGNDIWISTQRSLHHVERERLWSRASTSPPLLVSMVDVRNNVELLDTFQGIAKVPVLDFSQNSLSFRPFSGHYAWRRPPAFEVRTSRESPWTRLDPGTAFSVSELREGRHILDLRVEGESGSQMIHFPFEIRPPWYRNSLAYIAYGLLMTVAFLVVGMGVLYLARRRQRALEGLVQKRTAELNLAMEKLGEETRNAATLEERNRLAGEIHDSLQQGLSGAILQLDTTLKMSALAETVRARLKVVRNMISFTRHEVQHAVWDMETPLLEGVELGEALEKLTELLKYGEVVVRTRTTGESLQLPRTAMHHILRIAQEATTNAIRHSQATLITIDLRSNDGNVSLIISDNGVGFLPNDAQSKKAGHFGLRGMHVRAKKVGGELNIQSAPGSGTVIIFSTHVSHIIPHHRPALSGQP